MTPSVDSDVPPTPPTHLTTASAATTALVPSVDSPAPPTGSTATSGDATSTELSASTPLGRSRAANVDPAAEALAEAIAAVNIARECAGLARTSASTVPHDPALPFAPHNSGLAPGAHNSVPPTNATVFNLPLPIPASTQPSQPNAAAAVAPISSAVSIAVRAGLVSTALSHIDAEFISAADAAHDDARSRAATARTALANAASLVRDVFATPTAEAQDEAIRSAVAAYDDALQAMAAARLAATKAYVVYDLTTKAMNEVQAAGEPTTSLSATKSALQEALGYAAKAVGAHSRAIASAADIIAAATVTYHSAVHITPISSTMNICDLEEAARDPSNSVQVLTARFSKFSSHSHSPHAFLSYITAKRVYERATRDYYRDPSFRYFRLQRFMNLQRVEMNWVNDFCKRYGDPKDLIVAVGDWCRNPSLPNRQGSLPVSYRRVLQRMADVGMEILLVDEAYTSKRCHVCQSPESECTGKAFPERKIQPKPHKVNKMEIRGRLLCAACEKAHRHVVLDRDVNASRNIYFLALHLITKGTRPSYLPAYRRNRTRQARHGMQDDPGG